MHAQVTWLPWRIQTSTLTHIRSSYCLLGCLCLVFTFFSCTRYFCVDSLFFLFNLPFSTFSLNVLLMTFQRPFLPSSLWVNLLLPTTTSLFFLSASILSRAFYSFHLSSTRLSTTYKWKGLEFAHNTSLFFRAILTLTSKLVTDKTVLNTHKIIFNHTTSPSLLHKITLLRRAVHNDIIFTSRSASWI